MLGGIAWGIVWMVSQALMPAVIGKAVDAGLADRDRGALLAWGTVLLGLGLLQAVTGIIRHRLALFNWLSGAYRTIQLTVVQANRLGAALPKRLATGEVVSIGTADISHIGNALDVTARGAGSVAAIITIAAILFNVSVPLGLVVIVGVPLLMVLVGGLIRPLHRRQQAYRDQQGKLTTRAGDIVTGLRVLRGVGGEATFAARYRAESQSLRSAGVRVARVESVLEAAQVFVPGAFVVLVVWLGARFALRGEITPGQLVSFYGYASFLIAPLRTITETIDKITRGMSPRGGWWRCSRCGATLPSRPVPCARPTARATLSTWRPAWSSAPAGSPRSPRTTRRTRPPSPTASGGTWMAT
ncbi:hypothetical protein Phou_031010 [Phytohabitans houttuyneae]|uniref:ABC transmembrane type-1 domain-containing protein n=2 Tax=Phytohabitans houttuyneae TaxID=1076126 RepID=A0A6V8K934_9ACTN|nr:hypothetical protein Phou_031010 [Phytohabitans houttuyneae]